MSRLSNFSSAPVEIKEGEFIVKVYPLFAREQYLFDAIGKANGEDDKLKAFGNVVKKSLRDEKVDDEEIINMTVRVQNLLMDAIVEVNGYSNKVEDAKEKFIRQNKDTGK